MEIFHAWAIFLHCVVFVGSFIVRFRRDQNLIAERKSFGGRSVSPRESTSTIALNALLTLYSRECVNIRFQSLRRFHITEVPSNITQKVDPNASHDVTAIDGGLTPWVSRSITLSQTKRLAPQNVARLTNRNAV